MNILGNSIKTIRKSKKLTQKDLAKLTGFKQNTISNHENGKRQLDELDIRKYAEALNVAPQDLFDSSKSTPSIPFPNFDPRKAILLSNYSKLNDNRKNRLVSTSETLLAEEKGKSPTYPKNVQNTALENELAYLYQVRFPLVLATGKKMTMIQKLTSTLTKYQTKKTMILSQ